MNLISTLPRMLKTPTGWIMTILVLGFFYMQWPTHVRETSEPDYIWQRLDSGLNIRWEGEPQLQSESTPEVWALTRKRMSFMVQTDELTKSFEELVREIAQQDQAAVAGSEQEPLKIGEDWASYAFFDAESRIQRHRWYLIDQQWIKVSVLYKPSMESRVKRANDFLANLYFE